MKATVIKNSEVDTKRFGVLMVQKLMNSSDNEKQSISIIEVKNDFQDSGDMKLLAIVSPRFKTENVEVIS